MQQVHGNQSNRHEYHKQKISYPVLQLLKSIEQEKEYVNHIFQFNIISIYLDLLNVYLNHQHKQHLVM